MNKKAAPYILLIVLALVVFFIRRCQNTEDTITEKTSSVNRNRGFDRRTSYVEYTKHAVCRMDCRNISKTDIEDIMRSGKINYSKSDVKDKPCPTYAVQGNTNDGQKLRVIFAQCNEKTKVVTAYDLEKDFECSCPGDEKKNKN